jgi:hypothetical protein
MGEGLKPLPPLDRQKAGNWAETLSFGRLPFAFLGQGTGIAEFCG